MFGKPLPAKSVVVLAALAVAASLSGCAPTVTKGAQAVLANQEADSANVWVYLDTGDARTNGVYRCRDTGEQAVCVKAKLVTGQ